MESGGIHVSNRMRVVGWQVQPVVMDADGDNLTPVKVGQAMIPAAAWDEFKGGGDEQAMEQVRAQIEGAPPAPPQSHP